MELSETLDEDEDLVFSRAGGEYRINNMHVDGAIIDKNNPSIVKKVLEFNGRSVYWKFASWSYIQNAFFAATSMGTKITPTRKSQAKWTSTAISFQGPMRKLLVCNFYSCKCIFDFGFLPIKLLIAEETERKTRRLVELLGADRVETFTEADFLKHIDRDQEALFVIILHFNHLDFFFAVRSLMASTPGRHCMVVEQRQSGQWY